MEKINRIRAFNRFYTNQIGLLDRVRLDELNLTEARILYEIGSKEGSNARALAGQLGLDEGYLSRVIKGLEKRNLINRTPSSLDARIYQLGLSRSGLKSYDRLVKTAENAVLDMITALPDSTVDQMLESMDTVEGILSWPDLPKPRIREFKSGDLGWVIKRHGELYAANAGFDITFEALVAQIMYEFIEKGGQPKENGWIAESNGLRLGCVFMVADDSSTARLRLMLVEPFARGKGVGQTLIDTAINHARNQGFGKIVLWTQKGLEAACRLYERNNFRLKNSKPDKIFGQDVINQSWELLL